MANSTFPVSQIKRWYRKQAAITMVFYVAATFLSMKSIEHLDLPQWGRVLVALSPVVPMLFYLWAVIQLYLGVDEMTKRIQAEAAGIAGLITALICVVVGFLERAGVPQMNGLWIFAILFIAYGIAECLLGRRYR